LNLFSNSDYTMARFPDNLNYVAQSLAGWSVNNVKLTPSTLTTANAQDVTILTIPENSLVDLNTFSIAGDLVGFTSGSGHSNHCVFPRNIESMIDLVTVEINGQTVDGSLIGYNHWAKVRSDFVGQNAKTARSVLGMAKDYNKDGAAFSTATGADTTTSTLARVGYTSGATNTNTIGVTGTTATAISDPRSSSQNAHPFAITNWHGFLGNGHIIDTSILGTVRVLIRWVSNNAVMGAGSSYQIQNLRAYVNVCDVSDGLYYNSLQQILANGVLTLPFKRYVSFGGPAVQGSSAVRFSISTQSLDAVYAMLLPATTDKTPATTANAVAPYFKRSTGTLTNGVAFAQFDVNSCSYPQYQVTPMDAWYLLQNTLGVTSSDMLGAVDQLNPSTWVNDLCLWSFRFNHSPGVSAPKSGLDSRGLSLSAVCNFTCNGSGPNALPFIVCESSAYLQIGAYRSLSVVA